MSIPKKIRVLCDKQKVVTKAFFWKISHHSRDDEIHLKIGRYHKNLDPFDLSMEEPECLNPKSELTLSGEEFEKLIKFIQEEYEPFRHGVNSFISLNTKFNDDTAAQLKALFDGAQQPLIDFLANPETISANLSSAIENIRRIKSIKNFEEMLSHNLVEAQWQEWFENNTWVLGSDYIIVLEERRIDIKNIADFLMRSYDGFMDVIEIKRPDGNMKFWAPLKDHENLVPHADLIKAITQTSRYIYEIEQKQDSIKFQKYVNGTKVVKPRAVLIYGRSNDWGQEENEAYRILINSYHNLTILTYDHVLNRAKSMIGYPE